MSDPTSPESPERPVTMRTVAARAGVSTYTVSLSLRNHPSIPASTRQRIQKLAQKMGYRPNALVSALMASLHTRRNSSESPVMGLIMEADKETFFRKNPYYHTLLNGALQRAAQLGYKLENFCAEPGKAGARRLYRILHARNIRGVILAPIFQPGGESLLPLEGLACATLGYSMHKPDIHRVVTNLAQSMRMAWSMLMKKGYRRPGLICNLENMERAHFDALGSFLAQQFVEPECAAIPPLVFPSAPDENPEAGIRKLLRWFKRYRPDVLIAPPWVLLQSLRERIAIPEEAGAILFDIEPGWAEVRPNAALAGSAAVDLVVAQIHRNETGVPTHPKTTSINPFWVDGFSLPDKKKR